MNEKRKIKRIISLIGKRGYISANVARLYGQSTYGPTFQLGKDIMEVHKLFDSMNFTESDRVAFWRNEESRRKSRSMWFYKPYKMMPSPPRKDNKDYINYGSGGAQSSLRYPKKVKKTAWKRFLKLFPFAKDKH